MHARLHRYVLSALVALSFIVVGRVAHAQNLRVIPVPWVATDTSIPHQAYNGHATTFKAIARGGNGTYDVSWDFEGDGVYNTTVTTTNRYDLSATFTYPNQATTTTFIARVRVTSNGETVTGTYPVRVFADVPANPATATDRQLQVMRGVAVDDSLWYLHKRLVRSGNEEDALTGAQANGNVPDDTSGAPYNNAATAGFLWSLSLNGHFVAFPSAYIGQLPDAAANTARWTTDPYAEDAMRVINYLIGQFTIVTGIPAVDESNLTGFYPEVSKQPIYGTDDGVGFLTGPTDQTYIFGHMLAAFSVSHLAGYTSQVGDPTYILGRRFEYVVQQMVDGFVYGQNEGASPSLGSWYYTANGGGTDSSTTLWGITGLWHAETFAAADGVIVPNLVKSRLATYALNDYYTPVANQRCKSYSNGGTCGFTTTAFDILAMGWLGANQFDAADGRIAFPSYNGITRGQLRTHYDQTLAFINANFLAGYNGSIGWNQRFVQGSDFSRTDHQGNNYAMLHWQDAARAVSPQIVTFGANDWIRLFSQFLINNQYADGRWSNTIIDNYSDSTASQTGQTAWAILVLSPDAIPPLAIGEAAPATAPEGTVVHFSGAESDPGTGNPVYTWQFNNAPANGTASGQNANYAFPDNGNFNVTLTSTSIGGTSIDTVPVVITNVAPTAAAGPDLTVDEGTAQPFDVTVTDPGTADTFTYAWTFGDTGTGAVKSPSHTYADNGTYNASVTVTDDDGGAGSDGVVVTVRNVAPTITSTPGTAASEGVAYGYTITYTDPGVNDTQTCTLTNAPAGMTITGCQIDWTPSFNQALGASASVTACVTDDDGGQTCQSWDIDVTFVDSDNDGLPDSWEIANFGNITAQDQFGDPDGDGMNNLQEFNNVTDPNVYDGPDAPVAFAPTCGSVITSSQTSLVVDNATDPQGTALDYSFELYSDVGLTLQVATESGIAEGGAGQTTWQVPVNLVENATYYWRARAEDQFTFGAYSTVCSFSVDTINEPPGAPRINSPAFGAQVNSFTPALLVDNATDPDPQNVLTYTFEVYSDPALSNLVASQSAIAEGTNTTSWTVTSTLTEDTFYYWRVRATDGGGLSGDWSTIGKFFVTTQNATPEAPIIVTPRDGSIIAELRPELVILNADDADFDPLVYDWQLATDEAFANIVDSGDNVVPQGQANTTFTLAADLTEDTHYCWRARSDDGQAQSQYVTACFLVSTENNAPSVPTLQNPSDGSTVSNTSPTFSWATSTDPEGAPVTYDIEVMDASDTVVAHAEGIGGLVSAINEALDNGKTYTWHARAVDDHGLASDWSDPNSFTIELGAPDVLVNGGGCSTGGGSDGGLVLVGLGLALGTLRRSRRSSK